MRVMPELASDQRVADGLSESLDLFLWSLPGLLLWSALALFISGRVSTFLETKRWIAFLLLVNLGLIVALTLSPTTLAVDGAVASSGTCDLSRVLPLAPGELVQDFDAVVNILLFTSIGFLLALLPLTQRNRIVVASAFLLTFGIELVQLLLPAIGRGCESADMVDNTLGLLIGLAVGYGFMAVATRVRP